MQIMSHAATAPDYVPVLFSGSTVACRRCYAFVKLMDDGRWSVAVVGNMRGTIGDLTDFRIFYTEAACRKWLETNDFESEPIYTNQSNN